MLFRSDRKLQEHRFARTLETVKQEEIPDLSDAAIKKACPGRCQSLTQVLSTADARLSELAKQD